MSMANLYRYKLIPDGMEIILPDSTGRPVYVRSNTPGDVMLRLYRDTGKVHETARRGPDGKWKWTGMIDQMNFRGVDVSQKDRIIDLGGRTSKTEVARTDSHKPVWKDSGVSQSPEAAPHNPASGAGWGIEWTPQTAPPVRQSHPIDYSALLLLGMLMAILIYMWAAAIKRRIARG